MDLQFGSIDRSMLRLPASSQDAGVATGVTVNVGKVLAVANKEEYPEQETEEDSLSTTSTIDYDREYTDEEYPSITDDEDGSTDEEWSKMMPELERKWEAFHLQTRSGWPDKDAWVASWKEVYELRRWTWISVFAYFQKGQGYGGYGVILRNAVAKPIIASAKFSKDGKSFFYQVFMGIKAGVKLAEEHKRSLLSVDCNSLKVPALFRNAKCCSDNNCRDTRYPNYICEGCERHFSGYRGWKESLMTSLVVELRGKNIVKMRSSWNNAAHYLAKREKKNKRPGVEKKEEKTAPDDDKPSDMELDDFPQELKNILWKDAFATSNFMSNYDENYYSFC